MKGMCKQWLVLQSWMHVPHFTGDFGTFPNVYSVLVDILEQLSTYTVSLDPNVALFAMKVYGSVEAQ